MKQSIKKKRKNKKHRLTSDLNNRNTFLRFLWNFPFKSIFLILVCKVWIAKKSIIYKQVLVISQESF